MPGASTLPLFYSTSPQKEFRQSGGQWLTSTALCTKLEPNSIPPVGWKNCRRSRSPNPKGLRPPLPLVDLTPLRRVGWWPCTCNPASISMPGAPAVPFYHSRPPQRSVDKVGAQWLTPNSTVYKAEAQCHTPPVGRENCRRLRSQNPKGLRPPLLH